MFTAFTKDSNRISIESAVPGEDYLCPVCHSHVFVKAIDSELVRTHFAHRRKCLDTWKHDMSEWHLGWQSKFPIENQEVVVEKEGIVHRADVLINNTVIEFQHSPITSKEIEARNSFYKSCGYRVIWLFDVAGKIKYDECFELVWKRKTDLFTNLVTQFDGLFLQNYLPEKADLIKITKVHPKEINYYYSLFPIMPENFLKEFGAIQDENVLSITDILKKTNEAEIEAKRIKREMQEKYDKDMANSAFNKLLSKSRNRKFHF